MRVAVIGLGRFGARLAKSLGAAGEEVIVIDRDREIVESLSSEVTLAVALDSTDEAALKSQGVGDVEVAVVSMGDDFESSVLTTMSLKRLGVPRVIARATSQQLANVLQRIGADEVVNPEDESADRWAVRLSTPGFVNRFDLAEGYSIVEVRPAADWIGKTLSQLDLRAKQQLHVIGIRRLVNTSDEDGPRELQMAGPGEPLLPTDLLLLMGRDEHLRAHGAAG